MMSGKHLELSRFCFTWTINNWVFVLHAPWSRDVPILSINQPNYWATPTGEAQFKIRSVIGVRNGIPMGRLLCCSI